MSWAVTRGPFPAFKLCHTEAQFLGPMAVPGEADEAGGALRHRRVVLV